MLFDQNRVDAIIHNWKNQVFSNETIQGVPQRHSTCLKPPIGGFRNLASSNTSVMSPMFDYPILLELIIAIMTSSMGVLTMWVCINATLPCRSAVIVLSSYGCAVTLVLALQMAKHDGRYAHC